ncbi:ABC transporter ATP-binding protein [Thermomicrobiaceae bacterium CFH 74404]|uniref:ABC transporter ATP-binding protein n=1 Tax=Thermalbibacter longus TaxID=2951981 RepID=A0AA41WA84_9BACT|nr:ABC transporter ATP-binding protein [Thermalbibacter longus]MCM8748406.1 ABC transporter ATP-binding protein [Thermalbibacter longus]
MGDLVIEGLVKHYGPVLAVDNVSLTVPAGKLVSLLGPSGCGKTTTLNCIAGLERPDAGVIRVAGTILTDASRRIFLPPERRRLGMVFQSYALWPHMTVFDNLAFGLRLQKVPRDEIHRRITEVLELVGLGGMERRYPYQLSGGQQQRVALARAVVSQPAVLLLDEPLSNLDAKVREQARFWLREFQQRLGITTVYVTHDQAEALAISDLVAVMSAGKVLQYGPPREIYERPATRFVADFIGATSFLDGTVSDRSDGLLRVRVGGEIELCVTHALARQPGEPVVLAVRAERITLAADGDTVNIVPGIKRSQVYLGSRYQSLVETPAGTLRVETAMELPDGKVRLKLPPEALVVLPPEEGS